MNKNYFRAMKPFHKITYTMLFGGLLYFSGCCQKDYNHRSIETDVYSKTVNGTKVLLREEHICHNPKHEAENRNTLVVSKPDGTITEFDDFDGDSIPESIDITRDDYAHMFVPPFSKDEITEMQEYAKACQEFQEYMACFQKNKEDEEKIDDEIHGLSATINRRFVTLHCRIR